MSIIKFKCIFNNIKIIYKGHMSHVCTITVLVILRKNVIFIFIFLSISNRLILLIFQCRPSSFKCSPTKTFVRGIRACYFYLIYFLYCDVLVTLHFLNHLFHCLHQQYYFFIGLVLTFSYCTFIKKKRCLNFATCL